ncbi:MAG: hypothetical protein AAF602_31815 [Myxococcota bacterium]
MTESTNGNGNGARGLPALLQAAQSFGWVVVVLGGGVFGQATLDQTAALQRKLDRLEEAVHDYHREDEIERAVERRLEAIRREDKREHPPPRRAP